MTHSLTLGSLLLTDDLPEADHGYTLSVLAEGASFGVAQSVVEVVQSLLADGDLVRKTRYGNREVTFRVQICGPSLGAVAEGEAALRREVGRGNTLTWQAPDILSVPTVFEVVDSEMAQNFDDLEELRRSRTFTVTLTCAATRSAELTTVEAMAAGTASVTVDTCNSATGWSATRSGSAVDVFVRSPGLDAVGVFDLDSAVTSPEAWTLTRTGAVNFSSTPFLVVEAATVTGNHIAQVLVTASATSATSTFALPVLDVRKIADGSDYYQITFDASSVGSATSITFRHETPPGHAWQSLWVRNVARTDIPPNVTARQTSRIIEPGGTERTPASIHVEATTGVDGHGGLTIVHTSPADGSGYSPSLRRWRTSASTGPEYTDPTALSGKWEDIAYVSGGFYAEVPTSALPEGGYVLMARLRSATADLNQANLYWSTSTIFPDTTTQQGFTNGNIKIALGSLPTIFPVAALSLPSVRTRSGKIQIVLQVSNTSGPQVQLDEAWLFRADDDCALTIVNHYWPHLWLDSPDVTSPVPRVWMGDDRGTQVHPGEALVAMGNHVLNPGGTAVFTASLSDNPATSATFYRRYHSNAVD